MMRIDTARLLAQCVATLIREGREADADEAIRQGRQMARLAGPYARDAAAEAPPTLEETRAAAIRREVRLAAGLAADDAEPILIGRADE